MDNKDNFGGKSGHNWKDALHNGDSDGHFDVHYNRDSSGGSRGYSGSSRGWAYYGTNFYRKGVVIAIF